MKAVINIGTNTFHLNIADVLPDGDIVFHYKTYQAVKLGEGGINKGIIALEAYKRGVDTLIKFSEIIAQYPVKQVTAIATSAVRDAINGQNFIAEVFQKTNINIQTISGDTEAELIYQGTKAALNLTNSIFLIMDIGGGSIEFILCNHSQIYWKQSFKLGAARLMDLFMQQNRLIFTDIKAIENYLEKNLSDLIEACKIFKPQVLVGTAGSFETYAEIISVKKEIIFNPDSEKSFEFNTQELQQLLDFFKTSTQQQRLRTPGLIAFRVDMIVVASVITSYILQKLNINKTLLSTYALKEGALLRL